MENPYESPTTEAEERPNTFVSFDSGPYVRAIMLATAACWLVVCSGAYLSLTPGTLGNAVIQWLLMIFFTTALLTIEGIGVSYFLHRGMRWNAKLDSGTAVIVVLMLFHGWLLLMIFGVAWYEVNRMVRQWW